MWNYLNILVTAQKAIKIVKGRRLYLLLLLVGLRRKIIRTKNKGKTSVVKPTGGIAKNKIKAYVREEHDKGKCFHCQRKRTLEEELSQVS